MEADRIIRLLSIFFFAVLVTVPFFVFAYPSVPTHPALTNEMLKLYNKEFEADEVSDFTKEILKGSVDEDFNPRWLNHFYDPVYNLGLKGYREAPAWAEYNVQKYSWDKAIEYYANGDKKKAYYTLGHILHLIEDMTVPAHTRDDAHAGNNLPFNMTGNSPYEDWTKDKNANNVKIFDLITQENSGVLVFSSLREYFDFLAKYSNNNFFSEGTIFSKKYKKPVEVKIEGRYGYEIEGFEKEIFRLFKIYTSINSNDIVDSEITINDPLVLSDYWRLLSKQAVRAGAGVIDLFQKEAEIAYQKKLQENVQISFFSESYSSVKKPIAASGAFLASGAKNAKSMAKASIINNYYDVVLPSAQFAKKTYNSTKTFVINTAVKTKNTIKKAYNSAKSFTSKTLSGVASVVKSVSSKILEISPAALYQNKNTGSSQVATLFTNSSINTGNVIGHPQNLAILSGFSEPGEDSSSLPSVALAGSSLDNTDEGVDEISGVGQGGVPDNLSSQTASVGQILTNDTEESEENSSVTEEIISDEETSSALKDSGVDKGAGNGQDISNVKKKGGSSGIGLSGGSGYGGGIPLSPPPPLTVAPTDTTAPSAPVVISPDNFSDVSTTTEITFSGIAEALSALSNDFDASATTTDSDGNWSLSLSLGQGSTTIRFFATDASGNTSDPAEISLFIDSQSPDASISVAECQNSISSGGCIVTATELNIVWSSTADDVDYFEFTSDLGVSTTTATSTVFSAINGLTNTFSVRAKDKTGFWSDFATIVVGVDTMPVIINEIAWAGTTANSQDEWIELYNRTNSAIELKNWTVCSETDMKPYLELSGTIPAKGYYLIERTDDETISDIDADWTGSFGSGTGKGLSNDGEVLVLSYASTTIDRTGSVGSISWPGGSNNQKRTMERTNPDSIGEEVSSWSTHSALTIIKNGEDADGNPLNGTPKARNSINYLINNGNNFIYEDVTLTEDVYLVENKVQIFGSGATLNVGEGTVIKFSGKSGLKFTDGAKLIIQGSSDAPVVFTSIADDEYGGDLNRDATTTAPTHGDWYGVGIFSDGTVIDNAIFRYGGRQSMQNMYAANLYAQDASVVINNSVFEYSRIYGLALYVSDSVITGSTIRNNNDENDPTGVNSAIRIGGGSPLLENNTISENRIGISLADSTATLINNTFSLNSDKAIFSYGLIGDFSNNKGTGNAINGIVLEGIITAENETTTLGLNDLPYLVTGVGATVASSSTLVIPSGMVVKTSKPLVVDGILIINGDNPEDVVFTSLYDDSVGGDTNNDDDATSPQAGQGTGIIVENGGSINAEGFTVRYGGFTGPFGSNSAGITVNGGMASFSDALFDSNYPYGLFVVNSNDTTISNTRFNNHDQNGIWGTKAAFLVANATTTLSNVSFDNNLLGVQDGGGTTFVVDNVQFTNTLATTSPLGLW